MMADQAEEGSESGREGPVVIFFVAGAVMIVDHGQWKEEQVSGPS